MAWLSSNGEQEETSSVPQSALVQSASSSSQVPSVTIESPTLDLLSSINISNSFTSSLRREQGRLSTSNAFPLSSSPDLLVGASSQGCDSDNLDTKRDQQSINMASHSGLGVKRLLEINAFPPFLSPIAGKQSDHWGVVKITNIPYSITNQEVHHFISRLSRGPLLTPHIQGYPIHIVIERPTGKTMEVFVEFRSVDDAHACVLRVEHSIARGKPLKIGQRHVGVQMSDQGELMSMLFPRAKCVEWDPLTGTPHVVEHDDNSVEGFRGFFTIEEMASIVKHAETPQRSPFSARCMQRTYESMISTLYKFPWLSASRFTVAARDFLFTSYMAQLRVLVSKVAPTETAMDHYGNRGSESPGREVGLNHNLLMDFLFAGLNAVGFSMRQKWQITANCGTLGNGFPLSQHAFAWPFQCLIPPLGAPDMGLEFWLNILVDGFDMAQNNGLIHGFEKYIRIQRDDSGFVLVEFTQVGHSLRFQDAINLEQTLMGQMIEKGRMRWCINNQVPYQSLNIAQSLSKFEDDKLASVLKGLQMGKSQVSDFDSSRQENTDKLSSDQLVVRDESPVEDMRPVKSDVFSSQCDAIDRALEAFKNNNLRTAPGQSHGSGADPFTYTRRSPPKEPKHFTIDPRTPEFIPSQPWSGIGTSASDDDVFQDKSTLASLARPAFVDPFTRRPIPPPQPIRRPYNQSPVRQVGTASSDASEDTLTSNTYGHSPARSRSLSDHALDTQAGLIRTGPKSHVRRKTITVDTTIDEEGEGVHQDHVGGVHIKSYSDDLRSSNKYNY